VRPDGLKNVAPLSMLITNHNLCVKFESKCDESNALAIGKTQWCNLEVMVVESGETFFKPSDRTVLFYYNKDQVLPFHDCKGIFIGGLTFCEHVFLFTIFPGLF